MNPILKEAPLPGRLFILLAQHKWTRAVNSNSEHLIILVKLHNTNFVVYLSKRHECLHLTSKLINIYSLLTCVLWDTLLELPSKLSTSPCH